MVVVDTSVWIDYFNGELTQETDALDALLSHELVLIGDIILAEVLQGFRSDADFRQAKNLLEPLEFRTMLGKDVAITSAQNYRALRKKGVTVRKTIDVIIATFCIANKYALLHADRDFHPIERYLGLNVIMRDL